MKAWVREIPYLKGIAIVAVIAIHTASYYTAIEPVNLLVVADNAVDVASQFAVPVFVLASGLVLSLNHSGQFSATAFYKRRLATLLPPYLLFSSFYIGYGWWTTQRVPSASRVLFDFLTGNSFYHMWFIPLILQLYMVFPLLLRVKQRFVPHVNGRVLLGIVAVQMAYGASVYGIGAIANNTLAANLATRFFLGYIGYFVVGMYIGRHLDAVRAWVRRLPALPLAGASSAATGAMAFVWLQGNVRYGSELAIPPGNLVPLAFLQPVLSFGVSLLLLRWSADSRSAQLRMLGEYSLWIYLVHPIIILAVVRALLTVGLTYAAWAFYPVVFGSTLGIALVSTRLLGRVPWNGLVGGPLRWGSRPAHGRE